MIPLQLISIFDPNQLELLVCGLPSIDFEDLRQNTIYHGYKSNDLVIQYFWNTLSTFSKHDKSLFLQYVTGSSQVPLDGFKSLHGNGGPKLFNIHKAYKKSLLPTSHTCFNQLDLPEYDTEDELRDKLLIAIREGFEGFGFG